MTLVIATRPLPGKLAPYTIFPGRTKSRSLRRRAPPAQALA
jgi:hypothetical protein